MAGEENANQITCRRFRHCEDVVRKQVINVYIWGVTSFCHLAGRPNGQYIVGITIMEVLHTIIAGPAPAYADNTNCVLIVPTLHSERYKRYTSGDQHI